MGRTENYGTTRKGNGSCDAKRIFGLVVEVGRSVEKSASMDRERAEDAPEFRCEVYTMECMRRGLRVWELRRR